MDLPARGIYLKALRRAVHLAGGKARLRDGLAVPMAQLDAWLDGAMDLPPHVFLQVVRDRGGAATSSSRTGTACTPGRTSASIRRSSTSSRASPTRARPAASRRAAARASS